jgi:magnesium chelatase subunit I
VEFARRWRRADRKTLRRIASAKAVMSRIDIPDRVMADAAELCVAVGADGLRGELTLMRAARALAALDGAGAVERAQLRAVAPLSLRHRLRRNVLDETGSTVRIERAMADLWG